jgi:hypothetical protein
MRPRVWILDDFLFSLIAEGLDFLWGTHAQASGILSKQIPTPPMIRVLSHQHQTRAIPRESAQIPWCGGNRAHL